ncbi:MAG: hypothetical protein BWK76_09930 [Desulfobulbaceae bacterium A2]|nr:MAG: hypothetical protein BWK76_09930 [Desulfobulbaceae bacterium A2]
MADEKTRDEVRPRGGTERYSAQGGSVWSAQVNGTDRHQTGGAFHGTQIFAPREVFAPLSIAPQGVIDDRYRVVAGPLGQPTGEAEVFHCVDLRDDESVVAVKIYQYAMQPQSEVLEKLRGISHADLITLQEHGEWQGRFYEVMEFCAGGSMADFMPWSQDDLSSVLREIVNGLHYCHTQHIVHRDIKPGNIFFRRPNKQDLVIGDFGVSALCDPSRGTCHIDQFSGTVDYAAPELLTDGTASPKSDYYALGITLLHLLANCSPFAGMDKYAIAGLHAQGRVPISGNLPPRYQALIAGLLQHSPENRWSYRQILAWINNEPILADNGKPWQSQAQVTAEHPFSGYPAAKNPQELAAAIGQGLSEQDTEKYLQRGDIRRWVFDHFGAGLAGRIERLEGIVTQEPKLALNTLRYILDASLPLIVGGKEYHDLSSVIELIRAGFMENADLKRAFKDGVIEAWLEGCTPVGGDANFVDALRKIRKTSQGGDGSLGLFELLYFLAPDTPLTINADHAVTTPRDFANLVFQRRELWDRAKELLSGGYLHAWLRASFPDNLELASQVTTCKQESAGDRDLALLRICWHLVPSLPFLFLGQPVATPEALAQQIDRDGTTWQEGIEILRNGWLRSWLVDSGRVAKPAEFDRLLQGSNQSEGARLEAVLHWLCPSLDNPRMTVSTTTLDFGAVELLGAVTQKIRIRNGGRGHLVGYIALERANGLQISHDGFDGNDTEISITIDPEVLPVGSKQSGEIVLSSNGGDARIPVRYYVAIPRSWMFRSIGWGLIWAVVLGAFRLHVSHNMGKDIAGMPISDLWISLSTEELFKKNKEVFSGLAWDGIICTIFLAVIIFYIHRLYSKAK